MTQLTKLAAAAVAVTATSDGLTTGLIPEFTSRALITSASAANKVTLPSPTNAIMDYLDMFVGANGCKVITSAPSTISLNGQSGASVELVVPANTWIRAVPSSTTSWTVFLFNVTATARENEAAVTATTDGLTTGIIPDNIGKVLVTSDTASKKVQLPAAVPGLAVEIQVAATGYRLVTPTPGSISINGVTGASHYWQVPANSRVLAYCASSTAWLAVVLLPNASIEEQQLAITATAAGDTTGTIAANARRAAVTCDDSTKKVKLPVPIAGQRIEITVGANGYRLISDTPASVKINNQSGASFYWQVPASSTVIAIALSTTEWLATVILNNGLVEEQQFAATATADGLTTGIIPANTREVAVTCDDSTKKVSLPVPVVGQMIKLTVGANGFRLVSDTPGSVTLNGISGAGVYIQVPASYTAIAIAIAASRWLVMLLSTIGEISPIPYVVTVTADGTGTGTIPAGVGVCTVVSDDANKIAVLPAGANIGDTIELQNAGTGYEIRTSDPATISLNNVTGAGVELAVAANTRIMARKLTATAWIATKFDNVGAPAGGGTPDA